MWNANNVYHDGPRLEIKKGRQGISWLQTMYTLTDEDLKSREGASGYTVIANKVYFDGSKMEIERGCQGIR